MSNTECTSDQLELEGLGRRRVVASFSDEQLSSDAGGLLLREIDNAIGAIELFASCFTDHRDPNRIDHTVLELLAQRVIGIGLGYEDLNDHDRLRFDQALAVMVGKVDPTGADRKREKDRGCALAGSSTLNRLELAARDSDGSHRYHRIVCDPEKVEQAFVDLFLDSHSTPPERIVLDLDATDDPLHGDQEGRFFHGYYGGYCYLPLYIFAGDHFLAAKLRPANCDASEGALDEVKRLVKQIRRRWPSVSIVLRGDSEFARDSIMTWCENNGVDYIFGLAKNSRLIATIERPLRKSKGRCLTTGQASRRFKSFKYRTRKSWSRSRRVIAKAEHLPGGRSNPRFIVTSLSGSSRFLYEEIYCARGDMENRIKEQQLGLFADRTSTSVFFANQLRLWFSSMAYVLMHALRRLGLKGTRLENAQCWTIRERLLKIGSIIVISVRRVLFRLPRSSPAADLFATALSNIRGAPA